jgi:hypothetical protein
MVQYKYLVEETGNYRLICLAGGQAERVHITSVLVLSILYSRQVTNCSSENDQQIVTRSRFGRQESLQSLIVFFFYLLSSRTFNKVYVRT